jgi:thiamine-phosphate pyrophosphorylase
VKNGAKLVGGEQEGVMKRDNVAFGLYFIADSDAHPGEDIYHVTEAVVKAGVALVQYRAKGLPPDERRAVAERLMEVTEARGVALVINDLPELALSVGAAGVHLGQDDPAIAEARHILGSEAIIGATTPTPEAAQRAEAEGASYVSVGPVFASPTKPEKPPVGPERLRAVRSAVGLPLCAIGGITAENVGAMAGCGVQLVAVISQIAAAVDPFVAAAAIIGAMRKAGLPAPLERG